MPAVRRDIGQVAGVRLDASSGYLLALHTAVPAVTTYDTATMAVSGLVLGRATPNPASGCSSSCRSCRSGHASADCTTMTIGRSTRLCPQAGVPSHRPGERSAVCTQREGSKARESRAQGSLRPASRLIVNRNRRGGLQRESGPISGLLGDELLGLGRAGQGDGRGQAAGDDLGHGVEVAGADLALVAGGRVAVGLTGKLGLLQLG